MCVQQRASQWVSLAALNYFEECLLFPFLKIEISDKIRDKWRGKIKDGTGTRSFPSLNPNLVFNFIHIFPKRTILKEVLLNPNRYTHLTNREMGLHP